MLTKYIWRVPGKSLPRISRTRASWARESTAPATVVARKGGGWSLRKLQFLLRRPAARFNPIVGLLHLQPRQRATADVGTGRVLCHETLVAALKDFGPGREAV